jgi:putative DNA primase/helicase
MSIFATAAPSYWAKGLAVIPLYPMDKRPIPTDWSRFNNALPTPHEQENWIKHYNNSNIGLVLGQQSGICCIDIDSPDDNVVNILLSVLPKSPWQRIGKKGMVLAYKWTGHRPFRIKDSNGGMIVELLSTKQQVVLPPSIHPDTKLPYRANCDLLDVINTLPVLDEQIESILRGTLKANKIELSVSGWTKVTEWTPQGARDIQMTGVAGHYANGVLRGELSVNEAMDRMRAWYATCTEKIAGDDVNIEKGIQNLVKFVIRDVVENKKSLPSGWDNGLTEEQKVAMGLVFTVDQEEWSFQQIKDYMIEKFATTEVESAERLEVIQYVLKKVSDSSNLDSLFKDQLLLYIKDAGGMKTTMGSLRGRIRELELGDLTGTDHAQIARAVIAEFEKVAPLRYWADSFWEWTGSHWARLAEHRIMSRIVSDFGHLPAAKRANDHRGVFQTIKNLVPNVLKSQDVRGVNFANGFLMLNGQLVGHDPGFGMTYTLPFRYVPEEAQNAQQFMVFLNRVWGHQPDFALRVKALQEAICSTIFALGPKFQRAMCLYGTAKTGKSTLLQIIRALVPDEAVSNCPPDSWADKFAPATMVSAILNMCGELSDKKLIDGQKFKSIIDGEEIQGQRKGQQIFNFHPVCTHWFASNHLPRTDDTSNGFNRRWLLFTFDKIIEGSEVVLDYGEKIAVEEREAIVAWAIQALPELLARSEYTVPPSHVETLKEVATMNNSVRFFILDNPVIKLSPALKDPKTWEDGGKTLPRISETSLHRLYYNFCVEVAGAKPVGPKVFKIRMKELASELGFKPHISSTVGSGQVYEYVGIMSAVERKAA